MSSEDLSKASQESPSAASKLGIKGFLSRRIGFWWIRFRLLAAKVQLAVLAWRTRFIEQRISALSNYLSPAQKVQIQATRSRSTTATGKKINPWWVVIHILILEIRIKYLNWRSHLVRKYYLKFIIRNSRENVDKFLSLGCVAPDLKKSRLRFIRRCEREIAANIWHIGLIILFLLPIFPLTLAVFGFTHLIPLTALWPNLDAVQFLGLLGKSSETLLGQGLCIVLALLLVLICNNVSWLIARSVDQTFFWKAITDVVIETVAISLFGYISLIAKDTVPNSTLWLSAIVIYLFVLTWSGSIIISMAAPFTLRIIQHYERRKYTDAIIANAFVQILDRLEGRFEAWNTLQFRQGIARRLENLASCIEYDLPYRMRTDNAIVDDQFAKISLEIATSFRELEVWLLIPMADTREQIIARLALEFQCILKGNWHAISRTIPSQTRTTETFRTTLIVVLRALAAPLLLLGIYLFIQQSPIALQSPVADYLKVN